jgi:pimeloyl-ACP methyl ester carboxylesterase
LRYGREGSGPATVLIHGLGHRRQMWRPVVDLLADRFDMVAVDLPGFGESPACPLDEEPTPAWMADRVEATMDDLGWPTAHLVGNSLGGWVTLELARRGRARSVCALMPAGLWKPGRGSDSLRHRLLFGLWTNGVRLPGADTAIRNRVIRTIALAGLFGRPWRVPPDVASADAANLRDSDFARTMAATYGERFTGGHDIDVPVTVVFGGRDPLIRRRHTDLAQVPSTTRILHAPGLGHVPTWDDPSWVAATIAAAPTLEPR